MEAVIPEKKPQPGFEAYAALVMRYLRESREDHLYNLYELSKVLMDAGTTPADILSRHLESLEKVIIEGSVHLQPEALLHTFRAFLEVLSPYEIAFGHYEELKKLNLLQEVSLKLLSFLDLDSLCRFMVEKSAALLMMQKSCLYLRDGATGELVFEAATGLPGTAAPQAGGNLLPICIPLKTDKVAMGEIRLGGRKNLTLNEIEKRMAAVLAGQFALALERIRLYQTLEERSQTDGLTGLFNVR
ncbi:MAG: hypothetical protein FJ134_05570 [Deltaproteobacteria bacterium]|nr:hypothetical protein [Deltaproteobacteria bacterium]